MRKHVLRRFLFVQSIFGRMPLPLRKPPIVVSGISLLRSPMETVRFSIGEHTGFDIKNVRFPIGERKKETSETDCLPFENKLLNECPHFAKLLVGAYRIRPKASTWVSWCIRAYAIRPYIGYLRYTQCGKKMCRSSLYLHGNIFIK